MDFFTFLQFNLDQHPVYTVLIALLLIFFTVFLLDILLTRFKPHLQPEDLMSDIDRIYWRAHKRMMAEEKFRRETMTDRA